MQVIAESTGEVLYNVRVPGRRFQPPVFGPGTYTIAVGRDRPDGPVLKNLEASEKEKAGRRWVRF